MKLGSSDLGHLCSIAISAARRSGEMIRSFAGRDINVDSKPAGSSPASQIVTDVDLKSQSLILDRIIPTLETFDLGLLVEEGTDDRSRFEKDYFWCIDPLDGTLPFVQRRPGYAVSIALVSREGVPVIGVVYDPYARTLYHAVKDAGAFRDEQVWSLNATFTGSYRTVHEGGAVMNACQVLEQAPACFVKDPKAQEGGGALWDYAATACLFGEMGACARDRSGAVLDLNSRESLFMNRRGVLFASHREIAEDLLRE